MPRCAAGAPKGRREPDGRGALLMPRPALKKHGEMARPEGSERATQTLRVEGVETLVDELIEDRRAG